MWHKIPTHILNTHKGWKYSITKHSKYSSALTVVITPGVSLSIKALQHLPGDEGVKLYNEFETKMAKFKYQLTIQPLYPLIPPWSEAENKARKYINETLGEFDVQKALRS